MRFRVLAVLLFLSLSANAQTFVFHLRGDQEVPPVPSVHTGGCMGTLNQGAGTFAVTCVHDVAGATVMHIHRGAAGVNGPILHDLGDPASPVSHTWTGMTAGDISDMLAGDLYINIHTAGRPAGEIRGQILTRTLDNLSFNLDGAQVVPANSTTATGSCTADLNTNATALDVQCTHNLPAPQAAHLHEGAAGTNGPIAFTFPSAASPWNVSVPMSPQLVAGFVGTLLYLDVHGTPGVDDNPTEEIRGQIGTPPPPITTGTIRIVKQTSPAGGTNFGFTDNVPGSPGTFTLNDGGVQTFSNVTAGTYTITENAPSGYALADVTCADGDSTTNAYTRTATIQLQGAEVVTCTFRNLETSPVFTNFIFHLSGDQEAPPVAASTRGGCMAQLDSGNSRLNIVCKHNVDDATVMHIHRGAPGVNGPVLFDLGNPNSPVITTWNGMAPGDVADLLAGNLYVNIHTAGRPGGEVRGQILPRTVDMETFNANGSQVVPPNTTTATASCTADLDTNATSLALQCTHNVPSPQAAHIHEGEVGTNGPVAFTFASPASPMSGNMPMTPPAVAAYAASLLYLDIHGVPGVDDAPTDEIRGQIGALPPPATTGTIRIIKQTTPAGATGFTFTDNVPGSPGTFSLDDGSMQTFSNVPGGTYTITENLHAGFTLTDVTCGDTDSTGNPFARTATVVLQPGELVTCTFRNLQTFASPNLFVFHLSGDQEAPPVPSSARAGCMGQFDVGSSTLSIVCTHNVVDATVMHIHRGAPGVNGPIVFDLGNPNSPVQAEWTMSPADIADLNAGNLYVNIHTAGRPAGEIRGQILPRTVDSFAFGMSGAQEVPPTTSFARARCAADLSDDATSLFVSCDHSVNGATSIHLHDAPPGQEGPVVFNFPNSDPFSGDAPMTPRLVADFAAGFLYTNIHSNDFPQGEIRGQLIAGADVTGETIPTLAGWMAAMLAMMLVGLAVWKLR